MKKILVSMFAVAALAACSTEHTVVAPQNEAIGFDTFVENATRATDITKDNLTKFGVYASIENTSGAGMILSNEEVSKSGDAWSYGNIQYWVPQAMYEFTAFAPYTNAKWEYVPATTADNGVVTFNNENAAADQDFIFAAADRDMTNVAALESQPEKVSFTFAHELSKIAFKFNNGFNAVNNITLRVYNVNVAGLVSEATENIAAGVASEWTKNGDATFARTFGVQAQADATVIAALGNYTTDHHYFIPVAGTQYTITFDVDLIQAGVTVDTYHHTINTIPTLAKGSSYMFTTTLEASNVSDDPTQQLYPIEFTVYDVEEWDEYVEVENPIYANVATEAELKAAIAAGKNVKLTADVSLTKPVEITKNAIVNLNGNDIAVGTFTESNGTISAGNTDSFAFWVKDGGDLTITGEGTVSTMPCKYSIAVWAQGGKVTINGGTFKNAGEGSDLIYASANGHVVINGGEFVACEKQAGVDGTQEAYSALNLKGDGTGSSITCYGGRYFKFNPANNKSENPAVSFVAPGYESVVDGDYYKVVKM